MMHVSILQCQQKMSVHTYKIIVYWILDITTTSVMRHHVGTRVLCSIFVLLSVAITICMTQPWVVTNSWINGQTRVQVEASLWQSKICQSGQRACIDMEDAIPLACSLPCSLFMSGLMVTLIFCVALVATHGCCSCARLGMNAIREAYTDHCQVRHALLLETISFSISSLLMLVNMLIWFAKCPAALHTDELTLESVHALPLFVISVCLVCTHFALALVCILNSYGKCCRWRIQWIGSLNADSVGEDDDLIRE